MEALSQSHPLHPFREYMAALPESHQHQHQHPFNPEPQDHLLEFAHPSSKDSADERPESEKKELWSYHDTSLLLDLYEEIFLLLGRGMVRKQDWTRMAEQLSQQSGFGKSAEQCKNRIEYLRKQYRKEKAKRVISQSESPWVFYKRLKRLLDDASKGLESSKPSEIDGECNASAETEAHNNVHNNGHTSIRAENEPAVSPAHQNSQPMDTLDEEETVATTKGQAASNKSGKRRRKIGASLGKDLKEGLSEFAAVMERIERTKMEFALMLERQRAEQEQKRTEMEMERTRMLLQNQLEVARLFCGNKAHGRNGGKRDLQ